eukprot:g1213.t1
MKGWNVYRWCFYLLVYLTFHGKFIVGVAGSGSVSLNDYDYNVTLEDLMPRISDLGGNANAIRLNRMYDDPTKARLCFSEDRLDTVVCCQSFQYDEETQQAVFYEGYCTDVAEVGNEFGGRLQQTLDNGATLEPIFAESEEGDLIQCVKTKGPMCNESEFVRCHVNGEFDEDLTFNYTDEVSRNIRNYWAEPALPFRLTFDWCVYGISTAYDLALSTRLWKGDYRVDDRSYGLLFYPSRVGSTEYLKDIALYVSSGAGSVGRSDYDVFFQHDMGTGDTKNYLTEFVFEPITAGESDDEGEFVVCVAMTYKEHTPLKSVIRCFTGFDLYNGGGVEDIDLSINSPDDSDAWSNATYIVENAIVYDMKLSLQPDGGIGVLCFLQDTAGNSSQRQSIGAGMCLRIQTSSTRKWVSIDSAASFDIDNGEFIARLSDVAFVNSDESGYEPYIVIAFKNQYGNAQVEVVVPPNGENSMTTPMPTTPITTAATTEEQTTTTTEEQATTTEEQTTTTTEEQATTTEEQTTTTSTTESTDPGSCGAERGDCTAGGHVFAGICMGSGRCVCYTGRNYVCEAASLDALMWNQDSAVELCVVGSSCVAYSGSGSGDDQVSADGSSIESSFSYDIEMGSTGGSSHISDALLEVAASKVAYYTGKSRDDVIDMQIDLIEEDALLTTSGGTVYTRTYAMNFRVIFVSTGESFAAKRTLDLAIIGSAAEMDDTGATSTDGADSSFVVDVMSSVAEIGSFEWVLPMPVRDGIAFLPVENCSAHGKTIADTVYAHALVDGDYCLHSYYGWAYYIQPASDCYRTNASEVINASNYTIVYLASTSETPPPVQSADDGEFEKILYVVSSLGGLLLIVTTAAILFYRRKFQVQRKEASHYQVKHSKLKRELDSRNADMNMLISAWQVSMTELELIKELGKGSFGDVWQGLWRSKIDVAVKFMKGPDGENSMSKRKKSDGSSEESLHHSSSLAKKHFEQTEVRFLMRTRDPHIVLFLGCGVADKRPFILTEFCEGGSLDTFLWRDRRTASSDPDAKFLTIVERVHCLLDVALGLRYLHVLHKSIHRDLKSPNVLMVKRSNGEYRKTTWKAKIADFGLSRLVLKGKKRLKNAHDSPVHKRDKREKHVKWQKKFGGGAVGTIQWMAPEILRGQSTYGPEIDIYSFGILMWETLGETRPWISLSHDIRKLKETVIGGGRPSVPDMEYGGIVLPKDLLPLMHACQADKSTVRPTILEVTKRLFAMIDPDNDNEGEWSRKLSESSSTASSKESEERLGYRSPKHELASPDVSSIKSAYDSRSSTGSAISSPASVEMTSIEITSSTEETGLGEEQDSNDIGL